MSDTIMKDLRETRYGDRLSCPRCGGIAVKRNGTYQPKNSPGKRQRYLCNDCHHTFGDLTFSPLAGTHHPEKWAEYFGCMAGKISLRETAKLLGISLSTAFLWRHKILSPLQQLRLPDPNGNIAGGECSGGSREKYEPVARVRKTGIGGAGAAKQGFDRLMRRQRIVLHPIASTCFKRHSAITQPRPRVPVDEKGLQRGDPFYSRLQQWLRRFHGVSGSYVDHYLVWFLFADRHHCLPLNQRKLAFIRETLKTPLKLNSRHFRPCLNRA
ncbi:MAG: hypothetical protein P4N41_09365 [Negativicutes bacterium]|nr:hypothetical protein [Negativicutes bacterium]